MPSFVRRIVSGPKARLVDKDLGVDLDLSYITERIILMGFPASGLQGMYRNRRRDVVRYLDSKHADHYRIFNLCPSAENSYDAAEFDGRVSRFPWPDHHPPPLSMIPLFVSDMTAWLAEDERNVVVIHCKAGKGRSSTAAALYSISLPILPGASPSQGLGKCIDIQSAERPSQMLPDPSSSANTEEIIAQRLRAVMDLLTQRRLKPSKKQGGSLASDMGTEAGSGLEGLPPREEDEDDREQTPVADTNGRLSVDAGPRPSLRRKSLGLLRRPSLAILGNRSKAHLASQERAQSEPFTGLTPGGKPQFQSVRSVRRPPPVPARSTVDLRALGASPMGRSTDALTARRAVASGAAGGASTSAFGARSMLSLTVPFSDPWASAVSLDDNNNAASRGMSPSSSMYLPPGSPRRGNGQANGASAAPYGSMEMLQSPTSMLNGGNGGYSSGSGAQSPAYDLDASQTLSMTRSHSGGDYDDAELDATIDDAPLEDPEDPHVPRMAISIASQRRMIGYFARLLAGSDPRRPLYFSSERPVHNLIRITRITVDRRPTGKSASSKSSSSIEVGEPSSRSAENISIQLGRYEPKLVERLENWERGARRRAKAFRHADPSGLAPELPEEKSSVYDTYEARTKEEARQRAQAREEARWKGVEQENQRQRRLAQHGNEAGVGDWGINVWAESETARNFAWGDSETKGATAQIETFALLPAVKKQSSVGVAERPIVRHTFDPANGIMSGGVEVARDPEDGSRWVFRVPPTPSNDLAATSQDSTDRSTTTASTSRSARRGGAAGDSGSSSLSNDFSAGGGGGRGGPPTTAPTTPDRSQSRISGTMDESVAGAAQGKGIVVDADRELMIKVLLGRTGKTAAKLPDVTATGYVWFIPSFEEPELDGEEKHGGFARRRRPRKGARTEVRFGPAEIDFRKKGKLAPGGEIRSVSVEWEWVQTAWDHEDEEEPEGYEEAEETMGNDTFA